MHSVRSARTRDDAPTPAAPCAGNLRVAIVHDWLVTFGGAERVLEHMVAVFPTADVFALVDFLPEDQRAFLGCRDVGTSFIQRLPWARKRYRQYLPLMPLAIEQFDMSKYDIVISSSHAVAKGVLTSPDQLHVSYVHSPIRYAWDLQHQYLAESGLDRGPLGWVARYMLHRIRLWDRSTANGVDHFIANSRFIARRISRAYRRNAEVIYPPVNVNAFQPGNDKDDFYLTASRLVPYKRVDLIVEAFTSMPDKRLVVIGDGPDFGRVKAKAGPNVVMLGYQPFEVLRDYLQRARAFVFAALEDFGIVTVEAQACGTPVIAYGKGGALETVRSVEDEVPTGVLFRAQTVEGLQAAIGEFETCESLFDPVAIRAHSERFGDERFRRELAEFVMNAWTRFGARNALAPARDSGPRSGHGHTSVGTPEFSRRR